MAQADSIYSLFFPPPAWRERAHGATQRAEPGLALGRRACATSALAACLE
jgi:hypothetical protein